MGAEIIAICIGTFSCLEKDMNEKSANTMSEVGEIYMSGMSEQITLHFGTIMELRLSQAEALVHDIMPELMQDVVNIILPYAKAGNQRFDIHIHKVTAENVWGDSVRLHQVLINLLSNAIKFTPENGNIQLALHQTPSEKGENYIKVHLHVIDNGIGMSADAFADDIQHCIDAGMNAHTSKPIDIDKISGLLKTYIKQG